MTREEAIATIGEVIRQVQEAGGHERPEVTAELCPLRDLAGFDSMLGIVATGFVAAVIGCEIPPEVNLFVEKNRRLTLAEAAAKLCTVVAPMEATR